jgi:signal transduction histidine kinase/DNA-binding response OmpR family regulator
MAESELAFLAGGGETGALARSMDWRNSPVGVAAEWPQSLRTAFSICLSSRFPIALYWGPKFAMLYNDSLLPMVGANKHPWAMGRPAFEVLPEIRAIIEPLLTHVRSTGEATWSEDLMLPLVRGASAEESYFTFTYSPVSDESGGVGGVFCAVVETTEKVIEERRLRLLNGLAQATQARTPQAACASGVAELTRSQNDVPFAVVYLLEEGTDLAILAGTANIESGTALAPTTIRIDQPSPWPLVASEGENAPRYVELDPGPHGSRGAVVLPIERSGGGRPLGFLVAGLSALLRDSVSYRRFHNLLASSLSRAVTNAGAHQAQRRRAEELAELDRAKTAFFSNISHEFRTPLTLMLAPILDLLSAPSHAPADRSAVELLYRNATRLLKLVNTLLEFSRIEAGRVEAVYEPLDLAALTADLASSFRATIERAGLHFVVDCPPLGESLYVDRDMWEKVVLNLLSNAFKFTFEGSISVRLRLSDGAACLDVSDTGVGVSETELPRLFERFHRIEGARSRSHEGSGIGLALIQELIKMHGGEIQARSTIGQGTTFSVRIPRGFAHLSPERVRATTTEPARGRTASAFVAEAERWTPAEESGGRPLPLLKPAALVNERIVFADDNADMREYVQRLLSERWQVETVADGVAALEAIRRSPPALILCDMMMPRLDGFGVVRAVRENPEWQGIPIIILSARAGEEEAARGLGSGANDYIAKPFSARELLVRVASALAAASAGREVAEQRAALYRHFMQAPFLVAVFKGSQHVIELSNPACLRAWGKGPEVIGLPLAEALPELRDQPFLGYLNEVFRTGEQYEASEHLARLPTGPNGAIEALYYNFVYAPLRDPRGVVEGTLLAAFDVTSQVRTRQEKEQTLALLKAAHEQRSHALAEAERANAAKDEFLSTMSHELRTPLNAIVGWSKLLRSGTVAPEQQPRALETIERNAEIQTRLINDMLDLARIEQGKLVLAVGPTEMVRVVEAALDAVRPAAELKGVRLQPVLDSHATIVGDADRLQQVVWNLLSNAIKFTPRGGRVQVRLHREQSYVEVVVADDGQGIVEEFLPHVFDRFRQADAKISRRAGGLGLGLAIVRSIVQLHGGTVKAESAGSNRGATFTVRLPTAPLRADAEPSSRDSGAPPPASTFDCPQELSGLRILVVDDEPETRELLKFVLQKCEAVVSTGESAAQALDWLTNAAFDVLISDVGMPGTDGYSLISDVRRLPHIANSSIPAIALTAYARREDRTAALRAGFDVHLTKPIDPAELLVVIATLVRSVRRRRS